LLKNSFSNKKANKKEKERERERGTTSDKIITERKKVI
jgi:hypothetical protein